MALDPTGRRRPADRARDAELRRRQAVSVAGPSRHVVSMDPTNGKLLWNFVEPETYRSKYSMRAAYGRAWRITRSREGRHLHHDTRASSCSLSTRRPASRWRIGAAGQPGLFPETGVVDLVEDLIRDWEPWAELKKPVRPERGRAARARLHHVVVAAHRR